MGGDLYSYGQKKWGLIVNKLTKNLLILSDIKTSELNTIIRIFTKSLHSQLKSDGIEMDSENLRDIIGDIKPYETNNNRSANGSLNTSMNSLTHWKMEYGSFENLPFEK